MMKLLWFNVTNPCKNPFVISVAFNIKLWTSFNGYEKPFGTVRMVLVVGRHWLKIRLRRQRNGFRLTSITSAFYKNRTNNSNNKKQHWEDWGIVLAFRIRICPPLPLIWGMGGEMADTQVSLRAQVQVRTALVCRKIMSHWQCKLNMMETKLPPSLHFCFFVTVVIANLLESEKKTTK